MFKLTQKIELWASVTYNGMCELLNFNMKFGIVFFIESKRNMQVAEDIYDLQLTSNVFNHWNRYVCSQFILQHKRMKKAESHHNRLGRLQSSLPGQMRKSARETVDS
ncbi:hypothetical protein NQ317_002247 [Molorchus minor]|uniref:Uncharacterized protein n=1 Tax=Molorchus minor TaxID=1323400 RepID=A0ABQ9JE31_9CUCU|nr:hypothetical protein NQ317_002247 [Molorchus minor]